MLTSFSRASALTAEIVRTEPSFATERETLEHLLGEASSGSAPAPAGLVEARRRATAAAWSKGGSGWRGVAARRLDILQRVGQDRRLVFALLEIFAADFSEVTLASGLDAAGAVFPNRLRAR